MTLWARWVAAVHAREPLVGLALFRVAIGLVLAWTFGRIAITGVAAELWVPPSEGGIAPLVGDWRVALTGGPSGASTAALLALAIGGSLFVVAGLGTRVAALVAGQAAVALFSLLPATGGGHDRLLTNAMWLLVLAPSDASLSLACRLRTGHWTDPTPRPAVFRYLAVLQLCVVYTITGLQKLAPEWWPWGGLTAVYRSVLLPDWARWDMTWVAHVFPITQLATAITLFWEVSFCWVGLWLWRRWGWDPRPAYVVVGIMLHAVLEVSMDLGPFAWATLAFYLCLYDADEYRALARRVVG